jgi:hypothetical protein
MVLACRSGGGVGECVGELADDCRLGLSAAAAPFQPKKDAMSPGDLGASVADVMVSVDLEASAVTPICMGGCRPVAVLLCEAIFCRVSGSSGCERECACCGSDGEYMGGKGKSAIFCFVLGCSAEEESVR